MNKIIAVDVDLTVVSTDEDFYNWCLTGIPKDQQVNHSHEKMLNRVRTEQGLYYPEIPYNLLKLDEFKNAEKLNISNMWNNSELYDSKEPIKGSVETLHKLKLKGFDIVFVSVCFSGHLDSKVRFLEKHFPFMEGMISTELKHLVRCDYIIEDRSEHLLTSTAQGIMYSTPYHQGEYQDQHLEILESQLMGKPIKDAYKITNCWDEIYDMFT